MWPHSSKTFVPASEPRILVYVGRNVALSSAHRGWVGFLTQSIFEPGEPQRVNACGFLLRSPVGVTNTQSSEITRTLTAGHLT
jgi:hypothetical protein